MKSLLLAFVLCVSLPLGAQSQENYPDPPPSVIQAATAAFPEYDNGATFDSILDSGSKLPQTIKVIETYNPSPGGGRAAGRPVYPNEHIVRLVHFSDFVGSGIPLKRWTYITNGNCFAVSIFLVHVTESTLGGGESVTTGSDIYIARAGGPVSYKGHTMLALDPGFLMYRRKQEYIFFGKKIGENLYKVDSDRSLEVRDAAVRETNTDGGHAALYSGRDKKSVLAESLAAWQESNNGYRGGRP